MLPFKPESGSVRESVQETIRRVLIESLGVGAADTCKTYLRRKCREAMFDRFSIPPMHDISEGDIDRLVDEAGERFLVAIKAVQFAENR